MRERQLEHLEYHKEESRETCHYEYRNSEGRLLRATLVINTIPSDIEREKFRLALAAREEDEFLVQKDTSEIFPEKTTRKLESFVLTNEEGGVLDVFDECKLRDKSIILVPLMHAGALQGYEGLLVHEFEGALDIVIFLHEFGHFEQVKDLVFMAGQDDLSEDFVEGNLSSLFEARLEFDANRRATDRAQDWKQRGFDITGFYPIDLTNKMMQQMLAQKGAEEIRDQVVASSVMSMDQFITLQLLRHSFSVE